MSEKRSYKPRRAKGSKKYILDKHDSDDSDPFATDEESEYQETNSETESEEENASGTAFVEKNASGIASEEENASGSASDEESPNRNILLNSGLEGTSATFHVTPTRTRKRQKKVEEWKRMKAKRARTSGKEYKTIKGKRIKKREMEFWEHACRYDCMKITEDDARCIFTKFYELQSYDLQTNYIGFCIKKVPPKRVKPEADSRKTYVTHIFLMTFRVCKTFFLKLLGITNRRFNTVCNKMSKEGFLKTDQRGKHPPSNKISTERRNDVISHIKMFPRYKSHYSRSQNSASRYLATDLNIKKMYSLYLEWCAEFNKLPVKETYYRHIFCTEFNLKFHKPHSDTCDTCDRLNNLIKNGPSVEVITQSKTELEVHHRIVESVTAIKKIDTNYCKELPISTRLICFDLEKTLATPLLTTNKVYYLRQLWTYNFCIHEVISGKSYMYTWSETTASRGSQEVGSCLIKYIEQLPPDVKHLIAYSDSCGGQNKNKNIAKLFMYLVQSTNLERIDHKFYEPGHSYMECDRSFGQIEKMKKTYPCVFIPDDWVNIIRKTSKNFIVKCMSANDFFSFEYLHENIKDPKKDEEKRIFRWRENVWFTYKKEDFLKFSFRMSRNASWSPIYTESCSKLKKGRPSLTLDNLNKKLYNEALKISYEKWENLRTLLDYIPPRHHKFYLDLPHESEKGKKGKKNTNTTEVEILPAQASETEGDAIEDNNTDLLDSDYDE